MDPTWKSCPYCRMEMEEAAVASIDDDLPPVHSQSVEDYDAPSQPGFGQEYSRPSTRPGLQPYGGIGLPGQTIQAPAGLAAAIPETRPGKGTGAGLDEESSIRITGLLVSYTWHAEGRVYPLVNERNTIGRRSDCDIQVTNDPLMSSLHAVVQWVDGQFVLDDADSLNGTQVNGEIVSAPVLLPNYSRIRTGTTDWIYILVEVSEG